MSKQEMSKQEIETENAGDALTLIKMLVSIDSMETMRRHLRTLMDHWLITDESASVEEKQEMYGTFTAVNDFLGECDILAIAINGTGLDHPPVM